MEKQYYEVWWEKLSLADKKTFTYQWQDSLDEWHEAKQWPFGYIYYHLPTIELIYKYINK